jgi:hypothetical protein
MIRNEPPPEAPERASKHPLPSVDSAHLHFVLVVSYYFAAARAYKVQYILCVISPRAPILIKFMIPSFNFINDSTISGFQFSILNAQPSVRSTHDWPVTRYDTRMDPELRITTSRSPSRSSLAEPFVDQVYITFYAT